jgi:hypothetical protein
MKNQFEYQPVCFTDEYMMEADYDMALMMKDDCIKQLMALRELLPLMSADDFSRLRFIIRENLRAAQADIDNYESVHGKPKGSAE